jgi:hypothetical protein
VPFGLPQRILGCGGVDNPARRGLPFASTAAVPLRRWPRVCARRGLANKISARDTLRVGRAIQFWGNTTGRRLRDDSRRRRDIVLYIGGRWIGRLACTCERGVARLHSVAVVARAGNCDSAMPERCVQSREAGPGRALDTACCLLRCAVRQSRRRSRPSDPFSSPRAAGPAGAGAGAAALRRAAVCRREGKSTRGGRVVCIIRICIVFCIVFVFSGAGHP